MEEIKRYRVVKSDSDTKNQIALKSRIAREGEVFLATQLLGEEEQLEALEKEKPCRIEEVKPEKLSPLSADGKKRRAKRAENEAAAKHNPGKFKNSFKGGGK